MNLKCLIIHFRLMLTLIRDSTTGCVAGGGDSNEPGNSAATDSRPPAGHGAGVVLLCIPIPSVA